MDKTTTGKDGVFREERFRVPSPTERSLGLWVDRLGEKSYQQDKPLFRILGQYAVILVVKGTGVFEPEGEQAVMLGPGKVILQFPEKPVRYYPQPSWHTRWVVWNGTEARLLEELGYLPGECPVVNEGAAAVSQAYERLFPLMGKEDNGSALERKTVILEMTRELGRSERLARGTGENIIDEVVAYIQGHYQDRLTITGLSRQFSLSPTHFRRLFKARTGRGPREFITATRIARAKEFLAAGKRVGETARLTGFDDEFYFNRTFTRVTGVTPGRFA